MRKKTKKTLISIGLIALLGAGLVAGCDRTEDVQAMAQTDAEIVSRETETTYQKLYKDVETTTRESITEEIAQEVISETEESTTTENTLSTTDYLVEDFEYDGVIYYNGWTFTWYSENVLPGDGLDIPGRWSDGYFVRDCDGYICCASSDLDYGTVLDTPFGLGKVYDCGCDSGIIDLYVSF